jgi:protein-tyrosine phosphatase
MAKVAVANGITQARVTPHVHVGRWDNDLERIQKALETHRARLEDAAIPLELGCGAEVRLCYEVIPLIEAKRVPCLGHWDGDAVMLIELPHDKVPLGSDKFISWLMNQGIRPMIAHPERNKEIMRNPDALRPFVEAGCLVQLTADSVAGGFGAVAQARAIEFLEKGWVTVLASDAHDTDARPPRLGPGLEVAQSILGLEAGLALVNANPHRIVHGLPA